MTRVILPVKDLVRAKSRLAGVLAPHERRALAQAMAEDVLESLAKCAAVESVVLVSDDPGAGLLAHRYGVELLTEKQLGETGLNPVIAAAVRQRCDAAPACDDILVMHCDLPLVRSSDLQRFLARFQDRPTDLLIAPDLAGFGTNLMVFRAGAAPEFHYGPDSCRRHLESASALGLRATLFHDRRLGLDVDTPADLVALCDAAEAGECGAHTQAMLLDGGIADRLSLMEREGFNEDGQGAHSDAV